MKRGGRLEVPKRCTCWHREKDHGPVKRTVAGVGTVLYGDARLTSGACRACECTGFVDVRELEREVWALVQQRDRGCLLRDAHRNAYAMVTYAPLTELEPAERERPIVAFTPPACFGPETPHHLHKDGQGGEYTLENLVDLCSLHNEWVENEPDHAWSLGLVLRRGDTIEDAAARRLAAGITPTPNRR